MPFTIAIDARKVEDFGIGTYIRNLILHLAEIDRENRYILLVRNPQNRAGLSELPDNFQVVQERSPVYSVRELVSLSWRLLRLRPDLYHSTHYVLPAMIPCRVVVTIHDIIHLLYPEYLPSRLAFLYAQRMIRRSLTRSDRVIAVSRNTRLDLSKHFDVDKTKIEVIHNGVEDAFREHLDKEELERTLAGLELERGYVLFVGNSAKPHKNLDNVIQAYARATRIEPFKPPLVCVGDRSTAEFKIRQRAERLGIANRVHLLGHVAAEALPAIYQGAGLFLYPTLYEGFGLPVVEAMASGVPVITSNTSSLKEIAEGYAHLVDPLDVEGMARAIARCMADAEHRKALAQLGLVRAERFHWQRTARRTLEVYERAMASPGHSSWRRVLRREPATQPLPAMTETATHAIPLDAHLEKARDLTKESARDPRQRRGSKGGRSRGPTLPLGETQRVTPPRDAVDPPRGDGE